MVIIYLEDNSVIYSRIVRQLTHYLSYHICRRIFILPGKLENFYPENMDFTSFLQGFGDDENLPATSSSFGKAPEKQFSGKTIADMPNVSSSSTNTLNGGQRGTKRSVESVLGQVGSTSNHGVIMVPPTLPAGPPISASSSFVQPGPSAASRSMKIASENEGLMGVLGSTGGFHDPFQADEFDESEGLDQRIVRRKKARGDISSMDPLSLTEQQKLERRERNREHAKRSRIRKKVLLDLLQDQLTALRKENVKLRAVVSEKIASKAPTILAQCTTEESMLLLSDDESETATKANTSGDRRSRRTTISFRPGESDGGMQQSARILMEPDFRLIQALVGSQQNFVLSDPSLPDNPIVYCSEGFCKITGYKRQEIIGRNCRFLQGPGTDQNAVDIIRKGVAEGKDISVCLLNYKADGSPFWNQFFVAALKDSDGCVVNYVGVQCEVNAPHISKIKDRVKKLPIDP